MLMIHKYFPLYNHFVITQQMKGSVVCAPRIFCGWAGDIFHHCHCYEYQCFYGNRYDVKQEIPVQVIKILISFVCCSVLYLLWLTFTFAFDISIHNTYEIKFKVLVLISSTLISFHISEKGKTLHRRLLPFPTPHPKKKRQKS